MCKLFATLFATLLAINMQPCNPIWNLFAILFATYLKPYLQQSLRPICNLFAPYLQTVCNRFATYLQLICNLFATPCSMRSCFQCGWGGQYHVTPSTEQVKLRNSAMSSWATRSSRKNEHGDHWNVVQPVQREVMQVLPPTWARPSDKRNKPRYLQSHLQHKSYLQPYLQPTCNIVATYLQPICN